MTRPVLRDLALSLMEHIKHYKKQCLLVSTHKSFPFTTALQNGHVLKVADVLGSIVYYQVNWANFSKTQYNKFHSTGGGILRKTRRSGNNLVAALQ